MDSWSGKAPVTAYVAWVLAEAGDRSENLDKVLAYLRTHPDELATSYEQAPAAKAFLARNRNDAFGHGYGDRGVAQGRRNR